MSLLLCVWVSSIPVTGLNEKSGNLCRTYSVKGRNQLMSTLAHLSVKCSAGLDSLGTHPASALAIRGNLCVPYLLGVFVIQQAQKTMQCPKRISK